ncbi:MAG: hypothetical protein IT372_11480 [Polyangiaceae bacterium]|nr:hypothetical protein [Polyangiaceae bacterium]
MDRLRLLACAPLAASVILASAACGPPKEIESPASASEDLECPDPIGKIPRENCTAVGEEFGVLSVSGALQHTGTAGAASLRADAIKAAAALANQLKEKRLALCSSYNACALTPAEHAAKDKLISDLMGALIELWDTRSFADPEAVEKFHAGVRTLGDKLAGRGGGAPQGAQGGAQARKPEGIGIAGDKLAQLAAPGVSFSTGDGAVTVKAQDGAARQVLRSAPALRLRAGRRYLVKVNGSYAPATPPLLAGGDEVVAKVRYQAAQAVELYAALRSLDDPDASESTMTWHVAAGEKGAHEAPLIARPGDSGFFLAVGARGAGAVTLDDVELVRGGAVLAAARGEADAEPMVKASCTADAAGALSGKRSFRCDAGTSDLVTIGKPGAYLELAIRGASGDKVVLRTQSLEGGRSLDAKLTEDAELFVTIAGAGTATVRSIEMRDVEQ